MLCVDTSSWIAFWAGESGPDVERLDEELGRRQVVLAPIVLAELFSDPQLRPVAAMSLRKLQVLDPTPGYWERAGLARAMLYKKRYRPKLADSLIAQTCIDYGVSLLTRDRDFSPFQKHAGLKLAK